MVIIARSDAPSEAPLPQEMGALAAYLSQAAIVVVASGMQFDKQRADRGAVVPIGLVTDGSVVWPMEVLYYLENYGGKVDREILSSARRNGFRMPELSATEVQEIYTQVEQASRSASADEYPDLRGDDINPFA